MSRNCHDVQVEFYKEAQYYSHVIHLVSRVSGELNPKANPIKAFIDTFPAGTLSGAPKVKAMQLISEYEPHSRGAYGAGLFYWTGFDYRGEPNPMKFPATGSQFGILDYCGFPKDEAWRATRSATATGRNRTAAGTATKMAMTFGDYAITEAGFGADLGAEKFYDIKCRKAGIMTR